MMVLCVGRVVGGRAVISGGINLRKGVDLFKYPQPNKRVDLRKGPDLYKYGKGVK